MITPEMLYEASFKAHLTRWHAHMQRTIETEVDASNRRRFLEAVEHRRHPDTIVGFLAKWHAWDLIQMVLRGAHQEMLIATVGLTVHSNGEACFFSDDTQYGYKVLPANWTAITFRLPLQTGAGIFQSIDQFLDVFYKDHRHLNSAQEVCDYVNGKVTA